MSFDVRHPVTSGPGRAFVFYLSTSNLLQCYLPEYHFYFQEWLYFYQESYLIFPEKRYCSPGNKHVFPEKRCCSPGNEPVFPEK
jgi:hypothetical protein